jgi:hypothetical protein
MQNEQRDRGLAAAAGADLRRQQDHRNQPRTRGMMIVSDSNTEEVVPTNAVTFPGLRASDTSRKTWKGRRSKCDSVTKSRVGQTCTSWREGYEKLTCLNSTRPFMVSKMRPPAGQRRPGQQDLSWKVHKSVSLPLVGMEGIRSISSNTRFEAPTARMKSPAQNRMQKLKLTSHRNRSYLLDGTWHQRRAKHIPCREHSCQNQVRSLNKQAIARPSDLSRSA